MNILEIPFHTWQRLHIQGNADTYCMSLDNNNNNVQKQTFQYCLKCVAVLLIFVDPYFLYYIQPQVISYSYLDCITLHSHYHPGCSCFALKS